MDPGNQRKTILGRKFKGKKKGVTDTIAAVLQPTEAFKTPIKLKRERQDLPFVSPSGRKKRKVVPAATATNTKTLIDFFFQLENLPLDQLSNYRHAVFKIMQQILS